MIHVEKLMFHANKIFSYDFSVSLISAQYNRNLWYLQLSEALSIPPVPYNQVSGRNSRKRA